VNRYYGSGRKYSPAYDKTEVFSSLPCFKCKAWIVNSESENGGYCSKGRWRICKPYLPGVKPYEPKEKK
jgi:hypothetical protein